MTAFDLPERYFWQARAMARATGLNLTQAMADRRLCQKDYAGMIARCAACRHTLECRDWLAGAAEDVPGFCALKPTLDRIAAKG